MSSRSIVTSTRVVGLPECGARVHEARAYASGRAYAGASDPVGCDAAVSRPTCPNCTTPIVVAAFEGWNDAGDAASDALEHLDAIWEAETDRRDRRRGLLRLPGEPAGDPPDRRRHPRAGVAVDADLALPPAGQRPRHRADARRRAEHAVAHVLRGAAGDRRQAQRRHRRHPRRAAGRHPAHPAGAGVGRRLLPRVGASSSGWRRPATRARPASPACSRTPACGGHPRGDVLGRGPALRLAAAEPEGHRRAAAPRRGRARHRGAAGRPAAPRPRSGSRRSPR